MPKKDAISECFYHIFSPKRRFMPVVHPEDYRKLPGLDKEEMVKQVNAHLRVLARLRKEIRKSRAASGSRTRERCNAHEADHKNVYSNPKESKVRSRPQFKSRSNSQSEQRKKNPSPNPGSSSLGDDSDLLLLAERPFDISKARTLGHDVSASSCSKGYHTGSQECMFEARNLDIYGFKIHSRLPV